MIRHTGHTNLIKSSTPTPTVFLRTDACVSCGGKWVWLAKGRTVQYRQHMPMCALRTNKGIDQG